MPRGRRRCLTRIGDRRPKAAATPLWRTDADGPLDEPVAQALAPALPITCKTAPSKCYFRLHARAGFLLPGDLAGSPVLTFAP